MMSSSATTAGKRAPLTLSPAAPPSPGRSWRPDPSPLTRSSWSPKSKAPTTAPPPSSSSASLRSQLCRRRTRLRFSLWTSSPTSLRWTSSTGSAPPFRKKLRQTQPHLPFLGTISLHGNSSNISPVLSISPLLSPDPCGRRQNSHPQLKKLVAKYGSLVSVLGIVGLFIYLVASPPSAAKASKKRR